MKNSISVHRRATGDMCCALQDWVIIDHRQKVHVAVLQFILYEVYSSGIIPLGLVSSY